LCFLFLLPLFLLPASHIPALGKQLIVGTLASGVIFLILPTDLGFARVVPLDAVYANFYTTIFGLDGPHNLVPSLHVVWSSAIILACVDVTRQPSRTVLYVWLAVIVMSTILVHQHHIADVFAAALLVIPLRRYYRVFHA